MTVRMAELLDGSTISYVETDDPPTGTMKRTYFTPDRSQVVQFFIDETTGQDRNRLARLQAIIGKYNPTIPEELGGAKGTTPAAAAYFRQLFCWPTGIVVKPYFGIVAPTYPANFFFSDGPWKGAEKKGRWFYSPKNRKYLPDSELGTFLQYLSICLQLSRAIRRLHQAGLAHSDLSSNNVLIDPTTGRCIIIDIDSLVVPGVFPPDVLGTRGYIAPEVVSTQHLSLNDPVRNNPSIRTDLHALAVLIYEGLLRRHPLEGPKVHSTVTEEDDVLSMGANALFIENPSDPSNQPKDLDFSYTVLGPHITALMNKTFVDGLHDPYKRAYSAEWENALNKTWDLLFPCRNPSCTHKWFVLHEGTQGRCPFCGTVVQSSFPILRLRKQTRPGIWMNDGKVVVYDGIYLFGWHAFDNLLPGEEADRTPIGYCSIYQGKWIFVNQALESIMTDSGYLVPKGSAVELKDGQGFTFSNNNHGRRVSVEMSNV